MKLWRIDKASQERYWTRTRYRASDAPVVAAFADPKLEFIRKHISLYGKKVLDVGCGNGIFTVRLAKVAKYVVGFDLSSHMLMRNPHPLCVRGPAELLPFRDDSFDVVFEANLLHHVEDSETVLKELCRCSVRYVVLIEPNRINPLMFAFALLVPAERRLLRYSKKKVWQLANKMGLRVLALTTTGMISQNNTPAFLVPWLRRFDRECALGEYVVLCAEKRKGNTS